MSRLFILVVEVVALIVVVVGVGLVSVPAALVLFGVAVIVACEVRGGVSPGGDS